MKNRGGCCRTAVNQPRVETIRWGLGQPDGIVENGPVNSEILLWKCVNFEKFRLVPVIISKSGIVQKMNK